MEMGMVVLSNGEFLLGMVEDLPPQQRDGNQALRAVKPLAACFAFVFSCFSRLVAPFIRRAQKRCE